MGNLFIEEGQKYMNIRLGLSGDVRSGVCDLVIQGGDGEEHGITIAKDVPKPIAYRVQMCVNALEGVFNPEGYIDNAREIEAALKRAKAVNHMLCETLAEKKASSEIE